MNAFLYFYIIRWMFYEYHKGRIPKYLSELIIMTLKHIIWLSGSANNLSFLNDEKTQNDDFGYGNNIDYIKFINICVIIRKIVTIDQKIATKRKK